MYLFDFIGKIISLIIIIPTTIFGNNYQEKEITIDNLNNNVNLNLTSYVEKHDVKYKYNSKIPSNISKVIVEGKDKITYMLNNGTEEKVLQESVTEIIEKGTGAYGEFTGILTGYSADCGAGCTGEGYLACYTEDKQKFSIKYDDIYYEDDEYGKIRIVAAANAKFPCGTIVEITKSNLESYLAIVMDRGGAMNKNWSKGIVHMDLAFNSNEDALSSDLTGRNIKFSVKRWGW